MLIAIAAGGMIGATARYALGQVLGDSTFPWSTWVANVSGSFLLALVLGGVAASYPASEFLRPFLATGVLGSYTTFSAMIVEGELAVRDGEPMTALAYLIASLGTGLVAAWVGLALASALFRRPSATMGDSPPAAT